MKTRQDKCPLQSLSALRHALPLLLLLRMIKACTFAVYRRGHWNLTKGRPSTAPIGNDALMAALRQLAQQHGEDVAVWKFMSAGSPCDVCWCCHLIHWLRCNLTAQRHWRCFYSTLFALVLLGFAARHILKDLCCHIIAAFHDIPCHDVQLTTEFAHNSSGAGKQRAEYKVTEADDADTVTQQWAGLVALLKDSNSALLYHMENHYCLVFAARSWYMDAGGCLLELHKPVYIMVSCPVTATALV